MQKGIRPFIAAVASAVLLILPQLAYADVLPDEPETEQQSLVIPVIIGLIVVAAIAIVVIKRRKK